MNILILSWRCIKNPAAGGSEIYFHEMAKRWVKWGHNVSWFSPMFDGAQSMERCDGINIIRKGGRGSVYIFAFIEYLRGRIGKNYDIILDVENGIPFFTPFYLPKNKIVLHIHHMHREQWFREFKFPISHMGWLLENYLMPLIYKNIPVITLCQSSAADIVKAGISKQIPEVVNPGIDFYKKKGVKKSRFPSVLFLNRVKKYKGVETLLRAAHILQKSSPNISIWIAGWGDDLPRAMKYAKERALKNVTFFGKVSEEKKRFLMQQAWMFVNPSFKEGWGIVNIEANYAGTVVIGANVGGTRDSIINGKTGLLFPLDNARALASQIEILIGDKQLLERLGKNAIAWANTFDWDSKSKQYISFLERCANNK